MQRERLAQFLQDNTSTPTQERRRTMPEEVITDELIMGFLRFVKNDVAESFSDAQIAEMMDMYMRSRMAGG
jgi:hypothetical protein